MTFLVLFLTSDRPYAQGFRLLQYLQSPFIVSPGSFGHSLQVPFEQSNVCTDQELQQSPHGLGLPQNSCYLQILFCGSGSPNPICLQIVVGLTPLVSPLLASKERMLYYLSWRTTTLTRLHHPKPKSSIDMLQWLHVLTSVESSSLPDAQQPVTL